MRLKPWEIDDDGASDGDALLFDGSTGQYAPGPPSGGITGLTSHDATVAITDNGDGTLDLSSSGAGGGWTKYLDNALTSATGFTGLSGTWGAGSGQIAQTGTAVQYNRLRYDTRVVRALGAASVEARYDSGGSGATRACGLLVGFDGTNSAVANFAVYILTGDTGSTWKVRVEANGISALQDYTVTYTAGTYAKLSAVHTTSGCEVYYNGTYLGLVHDTNTGNRVAEASYVGLTTFAATASFRNLKTWGITPPTF